MRHSQLCSTAHQQPQLHLLHSCCKRQLAVASSDVFLAASTDRRAEERVRAAEERISANAASRAGMLPRSGSPTAPADPETAARRRAAGPIPPAGYLHAFTPPQTRSELLHRVEICQLIAYGYAGLNGLRRRRRRGERPLRTTKRRSGPKHRPWRSRHRRGAPATGERGGLTRANDARLGMAFHHQHSAPPLSMD